MHRNSVSIGTLSSGCRDCSGSCRLPFLTAKSTEAGLTGFLSYTATFSPSSLGISSLTSLLHDRPPPSQRTVVSFIHSSGSSNPHFHKIVSSKLNVSDLVSELGEFKLPTDGLKADLQARLQLAYLGLLAPEHEEEIASRFGLSKAGLDKKCKELGVVGDNKAKATMQVNRRAAIMKFLGIGVGVGVGAVAGRAMEGVVETPTSSTIAVTELANALPNVNTPLTIASAAALSAAAPFAAELARSFGPPSTSTSILPPAPVSTVSTTPAPLATPAAVAVAAPEPTASTTVNIPTALYQEIRRLAGIQEIPSVTVVARTPSPSSSQSPSATLAPVSLAPSPAPAPAAASGPSPSPSPSPPLLPTPCSSSLSQPISISDSSSMYRSHHPPSRHYRPTHHQGRRHIPDLDRDLDYHGSTSSYSSEIIYILSDRLYQAKGRVMGRLDASQGGR
ncbi:hypothetical protein NA56DRAFT_666037 [Hyaloscypha hepaticicola]|uniref:SAP domain-containing protein n=1 Tax=Hyaloscypha hepaticicola TaxID=2082293 RepID=A0A2J6PFM5_9HELO|nr:hypothetical protein NA56DRAFT_666037 [Hyaloscypha hepaticicola]